MYSSLLFHPFMKALVAAHFPVAIFFPPTRSNFPSFSNARIMLLVVLKETPNALANSSVFIEGLSFSKESNLKVQS